MENKPEKIYYGLLPDFEATRVFNLDYLFATKRLKRFVLRPDGKVYIEANLR